MGRGSVTTRKLADGQIAYRVRVTENGKRRSLGTFSSRAAAEHALRMANETMGRRRGLAAAKAIECGVIYFLLDEEAGAIKIGYTKSLKRRVAELQVTAVERRFRVVAAMPGGRVLEAAIHRSLADERMNGEWFRETARVRSLVAEVAGTWGTDPVRTFALDPGPSMDGKDAK